MVFDTNVNFMCTSVLAVQVHGEWYDSSLD